MNFPDSPSGGDLFNGFIYNATLGVWDVATSDGYFAVTANGSSAYVFNGFGTDSDSNPTLYLHRGKTYEFAVDATGHPFYIKTVSGTGTGNAYSDGVTNNGAATGTIKFVVPQDAPSKLYYNCQYHGSMAGEIIIPRAAQIDDLSDVDTSTTAPTDGQVLTWDNANSQWEPATASGGIALTDLSVTTNTAGTAALSYSNSTGVFSYTPPDLSSYLTSYTETDPVFSASAASGITSTNITNWNTAYGWGDHSAAGYLTSYTETNNLTASVTWANVPDANITQSSVTQHQAALSITESQISDFGTYLSNVSEDTTPQLGGNLDVNGYDIVSVTNGDITLDPNGSGVVVFTGNSTRGAGQFKLNCEANSHAITIKGPPHSAAASYTLTLPNDDGTADQVLKTDGSGNLSWVNQSAGSSYGDNDVDTHLNTSTAATNEVLSWNGTDYDWVAQSGGGGGASVTTADTAPSSPSDGDLWYDTTTLRLYVYYDDGSSSQWVKANPSGSGIALTSLSVTTNSAGTAALSYSDTTGVFSYTPPDLSSYLTSYTVTESDVTTHQAALSITESQISDFGTYNNYTNTDVDSHLNQSTAASNEILSWNGSDYEWIEQGIATVYSLTGTAIDPTNGGIQTKTVSANTTFTETLASGESVVLMLEGGASYTITWPTITWVTSSGNSAPTLTAKDTLVLWKVSTTLYGAYVGSYA